MTKSPPTPVFINIYKGFVITKIDPAAGCTLFASCAIIKGQVGIMKCPQTTQMSADMGKECFICIHPHVLRAKSFSSGAGNPDAFALVSSAFPRANSLCHLCIECVAEFRVNQAVSKRSKPKKIKKRTMKSPIPNCRFSCNGVGTAGRQSENRCGHDFSARSRREIREISLFSDTGLLATFCFEPAAVQFFPTKTEHWISRGGGMPGGGSKNPQS